ncbi:hypothetical protein [Kribbella sp. NPDC023855]|uniref:hypothetical protein n=1 Tax=Kribbella sp. NPDC023855 TaxID=3154698 RepID=UPI0033E65B05
MTSTRKVRGGAVLLGIALLSGGLPAGPADAKTTAQTSTASTAAVCKQAIGAVTAKGAVAGFSVTAGSPPTRSVGGEVPGIYTPGAARLTGTFTTTRTASGGLENWGNLVLGTKVVRSLWILDANGKLDPRSVMQFGIGSGFGDFIALANSEMPPAAGSTRVRRTYYGLRKDGVLFRWDASGPHHYWMFMRSAAGFSSVKTMTLISQTATYDTLLATTRGGALYTIRVPLASPMKPVVKKVRAATWGAFDQLVATPCGRAGTLLLAVDTDVQIARLYAVGHANGTATVIRGLGRVTGGAFNAPLYYRKTLEDGKGPLLYGE